MRAFSLTLLFLYFSLAAIAQKRDSLLYCAYMERSQPQLEQFFNNWLSEAAPISDSALKTLNDTIQNVYLVYKSFYNPTNVNKTGGAEWLTAAYANVKYLLVQDKISYGMVKTLDKDILIQRALDRSTNGDTAKLRAIMERYKGKTTRLEMDYLHWPAANVYTTLTDFRPKLEIEKPKAIALTDEYIRLLNAFLGSEKYKPDTGSIMLPAVSKWESQGRRAFLEKYIKIWDGQWNRYWKLGSYPNVGRITFDASFENAVIDYRLEYEGGYGYLKKVNGEWIVVEVRSVWII